MEVKDAIAGRLSIRRYAESSIPSEHEYLLAFLVKEGIFVHHVTKKGWWNSANGYAQKC
jgi:hypothetical protein